MNFHNFAESDSKPDIMSRIYYNSFQCLLFMLSVSVCWMSRIRSVAGSVMSGILKQLKQVVCNSLTSHTSHLQHLCPSGDRHAALTYYTITPPLISKCQTALNLPNMYQLYSHSGKVSNLSNVHDPCPCSGRLSLCLTPTNCPKEEKKERENYRSHLWSWTHNGSLIKLEGCPAAKAANPITSLHLLARNLIRFLIQLSAWSWAELARPGHCCLCPLLRELEKGFQGEQSFPADPGERTPSAGSQANWSQRNTHTRLTRQLMREMSTQVTVLAIYIFRNTQQFQLENTGLYFFKAIIGNALV